MRRQLCFFMVAIIAAVCFSMSVYAEEPIKIVINGNTVEPDAAPYIEDGTTMVPLRIIMENLGANVVWDGKEQSIRITKDDVNIRLQINNKTAMKNGVEIELRVAAALKNSRTFVPLRFIAESLGADVEWDSKSRTAGISLYKIVKEGPVAFKDSGLENGIRTALHKPQGDILAEELRKLTELQVEIGYKGDMEGIENLINLKRLEVTGQGGMENADRILGLKGLEYLRINVPEYSGELNISRLPKLKSLILYCREFNHVTQLKELKDLRELQLRVRCCMDLKEIKGLGNLEYLLLNINELGDISFIEGLSGLRHLEIFCSTVEGLNSIGKLKGLRHLTVRTDNTYGIMGEVAVEKTAVDFTEILGSLKELEELQLYSIGKAENLEPVGKLSKLKKLLLMADEIDNYDGLKKLEQLESLTLYTASKEHRLKDLSVVEQAKGLRSLDIQGQAIEDLQGIGGLDRLEYLDLSGNNIRNIAPLENLTQLKTMILKNNSIESISGIEAMTKMAVLDVSNNKLVDITPVGKLTGLTSLNLADNEIEEIGALGGLLGLTDLKIYGNHIADAGSLKILVKLEELDVSENKIQDIGFIENMGALKYLGASYNQIKSLEGVKIPETAACVDVTQNPISDTAKLAQMNTEERIVAFDPSPEDRLPGLTEQDKAEIIQKVLKMNVEQEIAPGTYVMLRFYDKYVVSVRNIEKQWVEPLNSLNIVCMTPKEMRQAAAKNGDFLKLEITSFVSKDGKAALGLECYWVIDTQAMNGGFSEFTAEKKNGEWTVECSSTAIY